MNNTIRTSRWELGFFHPPSLSLSLLLRGATFFQDSRQRESSSDDRIAGKKKKKKKRRVGKVYSILASSRQSRVRVYKRLITWLVVDGMLAVAFETTKAHRLTASRFIPSVTFARTRVLIVTLVSVPSVLRIVCQSTKLQSLILLFFVYFGRKVWQFC